MGYLKHPNFYYLFTLFYTPFLCTVALADTFASSFIKATDMKNFVFLISALLLYACKTTGDSQQTRLDIEKKMTTAAGLSYTVQKAGSGPGAQQGQEVLIYESMRYPNGQLLFALSRPAAPVRFRIGGNQVIQGVDEGVRGMQKGELRRVIVPPAFSKRAQYPDFLSPDSTLLYDIELVEILTESLIPTTSNTAEMPTVFAAEGAGIAYQSDDMGRSWRDISVGLPQNLQVEYVETKGKKVWLGSENGGVYQSAAQTIDWQKIGGVPVFPNEKITGVFPVSNGLFASVFRGGFFHKAGSGDVWTAAHEALKDKAVRAVLQMDGALLVGTDSGIYRSTDGGKSWNWVFSDGQVTNLAISNGILIGGAYRGAVRSSDGGQHWNWVLTDGAVHKSKVAEGRFLLVGLSEGLRISTDGGLVWHQIGQGLPKGKPVYDVERVGNYLICSHDDGISRSADWGQHWEMLRATTTEKFLDLAVGDGVIYGGTIRRNLPD